MQLDEPVRPLSAAPGWAQTPTHNWSQRFGELLEDSGRAIAVDGSGNVVMTGWVRGPVDFGGGVLTGTGTTNIYIVKFAPDGAHVWSRRFSGWGSFDSGLSIAVDPDGNVYVTGLIEGTVDFGGGPLSSAGSTDIFVVRLSSTGAHRWSQVFGGDGFDFGLGIAADSDGVVATGAFADTLDFGGGTIGSAGGQDVFVARFDSAGAHDWSQGFGDGASQAGRDIAMDSDGSVIVVGVFGGVIDFGGGPLTSNVGAVFVARLNASGGHVWSEQFGDGSGADVFGVAVDASGGVVITGRFQGSIDFGGGALNSAGFLDVFLASLDAAGAHRWSRRAGGTEFDSGFQVAVDSDGNVLATGVFRGTADFGGGPLTSFDDSDIIIAKFVNAPTAVAIASFDAVANASGITLRGAFSSDTRVHAVHVYRSDGVDRPLYRRDTVGHSGEVFQYLDGDVEPGRTYRYQIGVLDDDGEFLSPIVTVRAESYGTALLQNSPNPFNPSTTIRFTLGRAQPVDLSIYDVRGTRVVTLVHERRGAGAHEVPWEGIDSRGAAVSSGVYFYRLKTGKAHYSRRMVLLK